VRSQGRQEQEASEPFHPSTILIAPKNASRHGAALTLYYTQISELASPGRQKLIDFMGDVYTRPLGAPYVEGNTFPDETATLRA